MHSSFGVVMASGSSHRAARVWGAAGGHKDTDWLSQLPYTRTMEYHAAVKRMRARGNTVNDTVMMYGDRW